MIQKIEVTITLSFEERLDLWCKIHSKSKYWGESITEEQLNEWDCPTQKIEYI